MIVGLVSWIFVVVGRVRGTRPAATSPTSGRSSGGSGGTPRQPADDLAVELHVPLGGPRPIEALNAFGRPTHRSRVPSRSSSTADIADARSATDPYGTNRPTLATVEDLGNSSDRRRD